jgi:hypothetical protein
MDRRVVRFAHVRFGGLCMSAELVAFLSRHIEVSEALAAVLLKSELVRNFPKGSFLLREGEGGFFHRGGRCPALGLWEGSSFGAFFGVP